MGWAGRDLKAQLIPTREKEKGVKEHSVNLTQDRQAPGRILPVLQGSMCLQGVSFPITSLLPPIGAPRSFGSPELQGFAWIQHCHDPKGAETGTGHKNGIPKGSKEAHCLAQPHQLRHSSPFASGSQIRRAAHERGASQRPQWLVEISRMSWTRMTYWKQYINQGNE